MALKSREYEDRIKRMGFEPATKSILMELIEQHNQLERTLVEFAVGFDKMQDIMAGVVNMGHELKKTQDFINKQLGKNVPEDAPLPNDDRFEEK